MAQVAASSYMRSVGHAIITTMGHGTTRPPGTWEVVCLPLNPQSGTSRGRGGSGVWVHCSVVSLCCIPVWSETRGWTGKGLAAPCTYHKQRIQRVGLSSLGPTIFQYGRGPPFPRAPHQPPPIESARVTEHLPRSLLWWRVVVSIPPAAIIQPIDIRRKSISVLIFVLVSRACRNIRW